MIGFGNDPIGLSGAQQIVVSLGLLGGLQVREQAGVCALCGGALLEPTQPFRAGDTFTDWWRVQPSDRVCAACAWFGNENNADLQRLLGRDKPQVPRNYSYVVRDGVSYVLSKADKARLAQLMLQNDVPEVAVVATSGQKHLAFWARANPPGQPSGWVTLETQSFWCSANALRTVHHAVQALYNLGHSKQAIASGRYEMRRVDWEQHRLHERTASAWRGTPTFQLALFMAQRTVDQSAERSLHEVTKGFATANS